MENTLLLDKIHDYRIEIKYLCFTAIAIGFVIFLTQSSALQGVQDGTEDLIDWVANEEGLIGGSIGLFILALIANTSLLVQVPYTVPLINIALVTDSVLKLLILSIFTGMGAGIGEINSYIIARGLSAPIGSPDDSRLYRWLKETIEKRPRSIPILVFIGAVTPIPDDLVIWPLAIAKYPIKNILFPMFTGKIFHNFVFALIAFYGVKLTDPNETTVRVDWTLGILVLFVLYIMYQIEKVRQKKAEMVLEESPSAD